MGKYMRKAKISADVAVMEVSQSTLGVRTRAALKRLQSSSTSPPKLSNVSDSSCYLQLRSRRLKKPLLFKAQSDKLSSRKGESETKPGLSCRLRVGGSVNSGSGGSGSITRSKNEEGCSERRIADEIGLENDLGVEASFGENNLDCETRERSTRESTPCSLIRDADVATPGSSTRQTTINAMNRRSRTAVLGDIPSTAEIEEFFTRAEQHQQQQKRQFIEKYNFDIVNDVPLPGRYDWVRLNP